MAVVMAVVRGGVVIGGGGGLGASRWRGGERVRFYTRHCPNSKVFFFKWNDYAFVQWRSWSWSWREREGRGKVGRR